MTKCVSVAAATLLLSACGGKSMIEADASRMVATSPDSPWRTVENKGAAVLRVKGLEAKALVQVSPDVVSVIQAQLRQSLQPKYFTDLIIGCRNVGVVVSASPQAANLDQRAADFIDVDRQVNSVADVLLGVGHILAE